jgi:hypothetical protein
VRQIESKPSGVAHPARGIPIACWHRPKVPPAYLRPEPERRLFRPVILPGDLPLRTAYSGHFQCGICAGCEEAGRVPPGASGDLLRDQCGTTRCLN